MHMRWVGAQNRRLRIMAQVLQETDIIAEGRIRPRAPAVPAKPAAAAAEAGADAEAPADDQAQAPASEETPAAETPAAEEAAAPAGVQRHQSAPPSGLCTGAHDVNRRL